MGKGVGLSYRFGGILPETDSTYIKYTQFVKEFSEDGNVIVFGVKDSSFYTVENFRAWHQMGEELKQIRVPVTRTRNNIAYDTLEHVIDSVFSIAHLYTLHRNDEQTRFELKPLINKLPETQAEFDDAIEKIEAQPFYKGLLINDTNRATMMLAFANADIFNSEDRGMALEQINAVLAKFEENGIHVRKSGLPFIRTVVAEKIKKELWLFTVLAVIVTSLWLLFFFRSLKVTLFSMLVVLTGVVWAYGSIGVMGYKITALMGLIPPLIIVIGIPNCVFLLNKYHIEYRQHGNKMKALSRVIQKIGVATFMTNFTTAMGFATFIFTSSPLLKEFGVIASLNIITVFFLSILLIPIIFSYSKEPNERQLAHLDRKWVYHLSDGLVNLVQHHRPKVYIATGLVLLFGFYGISRIKTTGNIVDDLPEKNPVLADLKFFEANFNGVMPFEVVIDTRKPNGATQDKTLRRIDKLSDLLNEYPEISKPLSIVDAVKLGRQAFYGGQPHQYKLIRGSEKSFIAPYITGTQNASVASGKGNNILKAFVDSAKQKTRITAHIADIGTEQLDILVNDVQPKIDSIFKNDDFEVTLTGTSIVFLKGTNYLIKNLFVSLAFALVIIAIMMAVLFGSFRMVLVAFLPNLIPLIFTAGVMGTFGISIKPSTILVFSIAFGISVDDTIHYLAKYRQELKANNWNIGVSVVNAIREAGVSMFYTSIILFFGFMVFSASEFGGTVALGILVSCTLIVAMITNLVLLPALLMWLQKKDTQRALTEPLLVIYDEEEDIDLEELQLPNKTSQIEAEQ